MSKLADVAATILDHVNFITVVNRLNRRKRNAGFGPQPRQNDLFSAAFFDRGYEVVVIPGIHRSTLDGDLVGKHRLDLRPKISAETLALYRAQHNRQLEHLCRFRQCDGVIDDRLAVEIGNTKEHLRLMIDQCNYAVVRCQQAFLAALGATTRWGHLSTPFQKDSEANR